MAIMHKQTLEGNELVCFRHKFQSKGENQYIYIYILEIYFPYHCQACKIIVW
jgi:hypothetical protein